jgi:hypothetical protein
MIDKDRLRFGWMSRKAGLKIENRPQLPDGSTSDRPWWISCSGMNPVRGRTLRSAIDALMKAEDGAMRKFMARRRNTHG